MRAAGNQTIGQRKKYMLAKVSVGIMAVLLSISLVACSTAKPSETPTASGNGLSLTVEGAGFDSPEDAAKAFLEGLRDADLDRMISTFAVESYAGNYDFEAGLNRMRVYHPSQEMKIPNANELAAAMNIESRRNSVANMLLRQYLFLCNPELDQSQPYMLADETEASKFTAQLNNNLNAPKFQTLKLLGFIPPEAISDQYLSEQNQYNIARQAEVCGADQRVSRIAVFELSGNEYMLCLDAVDYGGKWYIAQLGGNIGNIMGIISTSMGTVPLSTEFHEEIHALIVPVE